jgi:hypothetical protein
VQPEDVEKLSIENMQQIATLTQIAESTSNDVDKLVRHMDKALPIIEKVESLERRANIVEGKLSKVTWALITYLIGLCGFLLTKLLGS